MIFRLYLIKLCSARRTNMEFSSTKLQKDSRWTKHAAKRSQQRGIKAPEVKFVFNYGDREIKAMDRCYKLCISKGRLVELVQEKIIRPNLAEKCKNLVVVTDGSAIITVYRSANV